MRDQDTFINKVFAREGTKAMSIAKHPLETKQGRLGHDTVKDLWHTGMARSRTSNKNKRIE